MGKIVTVDFRNDTLFAVERDDGVFVAIKPISDRFGLKWSSQLDRIKRDTILTEGILITGIPSVGGIQDTTCLRLELLNGWLFGIDESRVNEASREAVITYKRECYGVLFGHFHGKPRIAAAESDPNENENTRLRMVTEARQVFGNRAAAQLWVNLGLRTVPAMFDDPRQIELWDYSIVKSRTEADAA